MVPAPRTPLNLEVSFKKNYARFATGGVLRNISLTGAFLEVKDHSLKIQEKLALNIQVASRERKISAQVIWKNSKGVGVKFLPTNNQDSQLIDDLIYFIESKRKSHKGIFDGITKKVA